MAAGLMVVWLTACPRLRGVGVVGVALDRGFEGVQRGVPELIQPGADLAQAMRVDLIDASCAVRPIGDQAGVLEDFQVLRDGGPAHRQALRQLAHRRRPAGEAFKYLAPGRVGQGGEDFSVSHDLP